MSEDRLDLEDMKCKRVEPPNETWMRFTDSDRENLISEIQRLREKVQKQDNCIENYKAESSWLYHEKERYLANWHNEERAHGQSKKHIESLTKEREELNKEIKRINNIKHGWAKKSRRIRAENEELKATIKEMSEK